MSLICPVCGKELAPRQIEDNMCTFCGANLNNYTTMRKHPYQDEPYTTYSPPNIQTRVVHRTKPPGKTNTKNLGSHEKINGPNIQITPPSTLLSNSSRSIERHASPKQRQNTEYEIRLFGFARFFRDIFDKEINATQVIEYISSGNFDINSKSEETLIKLLAHIQENLWVVMSQIFSENKAYILVYWYGLDGNYPQSIYKIAEYLNLTSSEVRMDYHEILGYLRMPSGKELLRKICMKTTDLPITLPNI